MLCKYCGAQIPEGTSTCTLCGAPLKERTHKKTLFIGIVLCFMVIVLTATFILSNTYLKISKEIHSVQDIEISALHENAEISPPTNERIGDAIPIWDMEDAKIYRVSSEQTLDETDINDLVYKLQTRAGYYSAKAKILAENDCGTWYVKISIPDEEDEDA